MSDEFEDQVPFSSKDLAIVEIWWRAAWPFYGDLIEHILTREYRVSDDERREIAKCVLFLKTDQEYQWPRQTGLKNSLMYLLWLFSLGRAGYRAKKLFEAVGDLKASPFIRLKDLETARRRPPYLAGKGL